MPGPNEVLTFNASNSGNQAQDGQNTQITDELSALCSTKMEWLSLAPIPVQPFFGSSQIRNLSGFTDLKVLAWSRIESKCSTKQTKDEMSREA